MKVAKNKYAITVCNENNEREVEQMVGKAMRAYADGQVSRKNGMSSAIRDAECDAIVRCIGLFVEQPTFIIYKYVIARCHEEFGMNFQRYRGYML